MAGLMPATAPAEESPPQPFLRNVIQLNDAQLAAVEHGEVVTKLLPSPENIEIAAFGIVKTAGTQELLLRLAKDIQKFRKSPHILELGYFSQPPALDDLSTLTLPPEDIAALKKCKAGRCEIKLGTRGLALLARMNWSAPNAERQAATIFNGAVIDLATAYAHGGTDAMSDLLDKKTARTRAHEYRVLLAHSPYLVDYVKAFHDYLVDYPHGKLADVEDVLYWAKEAFGVKPVVSAYHMTLHTESGSSVIANKLIAATRYFDASLEILAGVPTPDREGLYLLCLYRARVDLPTGLLAGVVLNKVRVGVETALRENLVVARARLATGL